MPAASRPLPPCGSSTVAAETGGIDVEVVTNDGRRRIFQLKYFPGGFSGGWGDSRRSQITKSFKKALEHSPDEWTLVVPCGAFRSSAERRGPAAPRSGAQPGFVTRQFRLTSCSTSARLAHFSPVTCKPAP